MKKIERDNPTESQLSFLSWFDHEQQNKFIPAYNRMVKKLNELSDRIKFHEAYGFGIGKLFYTIKDAQGIHFGANSSFTLIPQVVRQRVYEIIFEELELFGIIDNPFPDNK